MIQAHSEPDPDLVKSGDWGQVRYARRRNGAREAKEWLENAETAVQAKFDHLFRVMAAKGKIFNKEHFRLLEDGIWEFKRDGDRILCFQSGRSWFLTHHYSKGGRAKCPPGEIKRAIEIRAEHLESTSGNVN
jgi:hypothetical protein